MFENDNMNEFDLMMKSVLGEAQEEVPERVWEGVSAGLDKAARRKVVALWWRRAAVGVAAAAAVVLGVFLVNHDDNQMVPMVEEGDMIAVVEPEAVVPAEDEEVVSDEADVTDVSLLAAIGEDEVHVPAKTEDAVPGSAAEAMEVLNDVKVEEAAADEAVAEDEAVAVENENIENETVEYFPEDWGEDEVKKRRDVALTLSGITGTNNAMNPNKSGMMMAPSLNPAPKESGIEETSTKSSYGIPLSFGAGVKVGLSKRWSIGAGLNYTFLSRQFYGKYTKVGPTGDIENVTSSDIRNRQHYIGIPVNVFYDVISNDKINFYAYAGGTIEKCLSDSYSLLNTSIRHKEKIEGVQLSANAGIGVEFRLGKHLGLYIDPSVRYYFENEKQPKSIRTVQPLMLGFEMGLRARL